MARRRRSRVSTRPPSGAPSAPVKSVATKRPSSTNRPRHAVVLAVGALVVLTAGALYVRTTARDIVFGDSPELTAVAVTLGVAHPPGYPVWTILAHLFSLIPFGPLPFRVSLFSVAASLGALALVYALGQRITRDAWAAGAAALVLALSPAHWAWSLVPEVFPLNDALAALLVYLLYLWHREGRPSLFVAAALVGGIGMANQQTIALLGPAILFLMWHHRGRFRDGVLLLNAAVAAMLGLLPYAYLPIAASQGPHWNWGGISSLSDLVAHALRVGYGSTQLVSEPLLAGGATTDRVFDLLRSFTPIEGALIVLGCVFLYRHDAVWLGFAGAAAGVAGPVFFVYANINVSAFDVTRAVLERFALLPHVLLAPLAAAGIAEVGTLRGRLRAVPARIGSRGLQLAAAGASVLLAGTIAAASFADIDQSQNHVARTFGQDILRTVRPNAILHAAGDPIVMPVDYLMNVEGERPDVTFVQIPLLRADWYVQQLRRRYPRLALPGPIPPNTSRDLILPNDPGRVDIMGQLPDDSLKTYGFYRRGLVQELRPVGEVIDPAAVAAANDALLRSYHIPKVPEHGRRRWERLILADYSYPAIDVASLWERAKDLQKAHEWYARALDIDPQSAEARQGLARTAP